MHASRGTGRTWIALASLAVLATTAARAEPTPFFPGPGQPSVFRGSVTAIGGMNFIQADVSNRKLRFDVDDDPSTGDSSSDVLHLPPDATVVYALLYWSQSTYVGMDPPPAPRYPIAATAAATHARMKTPDGADHTVTADQVEHVSLGAGTVEHLAWSDVTALVAPFTAGGQFTVANIVSEEMENVWALYVVYNDPHAPLRNIRLWNIDEYVWGAFGIHTTIFHLTDAPTPAVTRGIFIAHGTNGQLNYKDGEFMRVDGHDLNDALNPPGEVWNSSRSVFGVQDADANPQPITVYDPTLGGGGFCGLDLDLFSVDGVLAPLTSTHEVQLDTTGVELFYLHAAALAVEVIAPELEFTKAMVPLDAPPVVPGDSLEVRLHIADTGSDDAVGLAIEDVLPPGLLYVPGSLALIEGGVTTSLSDASGDDRGDFDGAAVHVRLGVGADAGAGGTLAVGASGDVRFTARVDPDIVAPTTIFNQAVAHFAGASAPNAPILVKSSAATGVDAAATEIVIVDDGCDASDCGDGAVWIAVTDAAGQAQGAVRCALTGATVSCDAGPDGTLVVYPGRFCQ